MKTETMSYSHAEVLSPIFQTFQINGQRITINHVMSAKGEGYEVFIGHLPRNMLENELLPLLLSVGHLTEVRIMMNFSGNNRGFAFARFSNPQSAENAVKHLNNFEIRAGCRIAVLASKDKKKLFIGRLPRNLEEKSIAEVLRKATDNVTNVQIKYFTRNGTSRRYCIVTYRTHMDACKARRTLVVQANIIFEANVVVDWAIVDKDEIEARKVLLNLKRSNIKVVSQNLINKQNQNKTDCNGTCLASEMEKLFIEEPHSKVTDRQTYGMMSDNRQRGSLSPTDSLCSEDTNFSEPKKDIQSSRRRVCGSKELISKQQPSIRSEKTKLRTLKSTTMVCQLCGPNCCFSKKSLKLNYLIEKRRAHQKTIRCS